MKFSDLFHINDIIRERDEYKAKFADASDRYNSLLEEYREQKAMLTPEMKDAMQSKKIVAQLHDNIATLESKKGIVQLFLNLAAH